MEQLNGTLNGVGLIGGYLTGVGAIDGQLNIGSGGGTYPHYQGDYTVTPLTRGAVVLDTNGKVMDDDVTVIKIPYFETSNVSGKTVYIGEIE